MKILIISSLLLLGGCASTLDGAVQDTSRNLNRAANYLHENRDEINAAAQTAGEMAKQGGRLIGRGMEKTGEYIQDISQ